MDKMAAQDMLPMYVWPELPHSQHGLYFGSGRFTGRPASRLECGAAHGNCLACLSNVLLFLRGQA